MDITYKAVKSGYIKHSTKRLRRGHVPRKQGTTALERVRYGRIYTHAHRKHVVKPYVRKHTSKRTSTYKRIKRHTNLGATKTHIVKAPTTTMVPFKIAKKRKLHDTPRTGRSKNTTKLVSIPTIHVVALKKRKKRSATYVDAFNTDMDKMFAAM